jgi:hypothetical protein
MGNGEPVQRCDGASDKHGNPFGIMMLTHSARWRRRTAVISLQVAAGIKSVNIRMPPTDGRGPANGAAGQRSRTDRAP